ncbi:protein eyes shut homolog isoform X2 [Brachyhypopomus gauderio]
MIEIAAANGTANRRQKYVSKPTAEAAFGPVFLGGVPTSAELHADAGSVSGFTGCLRELQINSREICLVSETVRGRNIHSCGTSSCRRQPCRDGATCISDAVRRPCTCPLPRQTSLHQTDTCQCNPCARGATCVPRPWAEVACLCPHGRQGLLCSDDISVTRPRFSGRDEFGYTSYMAYSPIRSMQHFYEFRLKLMFSSDASALKDSLVLFSGQKGQGVDGDDFLALGVRNGRIVHKYNLGSGVATIVSERLNQRMKIHTVRFGRHLRRGWLKVDAQRNKTGVSPGRLSGLNTFSQLFVGGYSNRGPEQLPAGSRFTDGFRGCIFDVQFRTAPYGRFRAPGDPEGRPASSRSVGQCGVSPCVLLRCHNGGTCVDSGSSVYCRCVSGWKGALCSETASFCDNGHAPPPSCVRNATCVPLPDGYRCQCPLGTSGQLCQQVLSISDAGFNASRSSWMSFPPVSMRHRTHLQLQFQTVSPEGIIFYTAQSPSAQAGDFISVVLSDGFVQLRYNLGDGTIVLQSRNRVDQTGRTWHLVQAGREGNRGYLVLDNQVVKHNSSGGMTTLDVATDIYVGGVSSLTTICPDAVAKQQVGFSGGVREVVVNGRELELTEGGVLGGADVGDWDGTACGYKVCRNGGLCHPDGPASFRCDCPPSWTGTRCEQPVRCVGNLCRHGAVCVPHDTAMTYSCVCAFGWHGPYCSQQASMTTARFVGNSYLKYRDSKYNSRNLTYTQVSFNLSTSSEDGLILWAGPADSDDGDYLALGLQYGRLKIAINLGAKVALPVVSQNTALCCERWNYISIIQNRTLIQAFVNGQRVLFEDVDPFECYVAVNHRGVYYFGGFELGRDVSTVTGGLFTAGLVGSIKDILLYQDAETLPFLPTYEGFNVYPGED